MVSYMNKKKYFIYVLLLLVYIFLIVAAFLSVDRISTVNTFSKNAPNIIIDAGHGGEDGGAVDNGTVEKNINLKISLKLKELFKISGFNVVMTRNSDKMINESGTSLRERKVSDMKKRLELFNNDINNIVISIHQNKFTVEKYSGTQVFYGKNNKNSALLAESIKNNVKALLQPDNERAVKPADRNIYLLYNSDVPAVIVECGFISNYNEAKKLNDNDYQNKIAFAVFSGFMDFYNNLRG